jgi:hypothetical protein
MSLILDYKSIIEDAQLVWTMVAVQLEIKQILYCVAFISFLFYNWKVVGACLTTKKTNGSNIFEFGVVEMDELEFFLREHKWKMSIQKKYVRIQIQILYFHL